MKLVFLGPPGAGKGTQAAKMSAEFGIRHASTGEIFREAIAQGSELGEAVKSYLDSGRLVPDDLTAQVVRQMVVDRFDRFILDGFPRTVPQADALERMLQDRGKRLDAALYFQLDEKDCVRRLSGRVVCRQCGANYHREFLPPARDGVCDACGGELVVRSDSSEEAVRNRFADYCSKTQPVTQYYEERGLLMTVDAAQTPDEVSAAARELIAALEQR